MVSKVIERPAYSLPVQGAESAFVQQLLQTTQQHGYAINQLIGLLEAGTFTPVLTFATPGDVSVVYAAQLGYFWRIGPLVFYTINLQCTPTHTTASGFLEITGLPYTAAASPVANIGSGLTSNGITLPANHETIGPWLVGGSAVLQLIMQAGASYTRTTEAHVPTGVETYLQLQGFYPTDDVEGF